MGLAVGIIVLDLPFPIGKGVTGKRSRSVSPEGHPRKRSRREKWAASCPFNFFLNTVKDAKETWEETLSIGIAGGFVMKLVEIEA